MHDSDHEGVVRIFVCHSYHSNELFILYYAAQFFPYQECNQSKCVCVCVWGGGGGGGGGAYDWETMIIYIALLSMVKAASEKEPCKED